MAIDVTVLGASGTTVTIPFTSQDVANAAQTALGVVSNDVTGGVLTQVNYTGGSTVPSVSTSLGGVLAVSSVTGLPTFSIGGQYVSAVDGGAGVQSIIVNFGANNATVASGSGGSTVDGTPTVVSGAGGAEIGNLGTNTQVFLGGAAIQDFAELGLGAFGVPSNPSATVWVSTPLRGTANFDDSSGNTTINLDTVASAGGTFHVFGQTLIVNNSGNGNTTVNVQSNNSGGAVDGDVMSFRGGSTVATTVNAAGGVNSLGAATGGVSLWALLKSGNAFINGNGSNVVVFPTGGTAVAATLFGGSGSDVVISANGLLEGGSAGNNLIYGGLSPGSTTIVGGGNDDNLVGQTAGTLIKAGPQGEFLFGLSNGITFQGFSGVQAAGIQTLMDGTTGGDTFITGNASDGSGSTPGGTNIFATDTNGGNLFQEGVVNSGVGTNANSATINGFTSGTDTISLSDPAGGVYSLIGSSTVLPTGANVDYSTSGGNTTVNFGDGTTWTLMNVTLQNTDFH